MNKVISGLILLLVILGCRHPQSVNIFMEDLLLGDALKKSGEKLINHSLGMHRVEYPNTREDTIFVAVHGYGSRGYEWIYPLISMTRTGHMTYFYRWDWFNCPKKAAAQLKIEIGSLISKHGTLGHLIIVGHSYGGNLVAALAGIGLDISAEFHVVAAPLTGHPRLNNRCPDFPAYATADLESEKFIQWRTQHDQDGAFKDLPVDPQQVDIPGSLVILLPDSVDGFRLGHNRSISWVMDSLLVNLKQER